MSNLVATSERLVLSRERLRQAMREGSAVDSSATKRSQGNSGMAWLDGLKSVPAGSVLFEAVINWWATQPLRVASLAAVDAVKTVVHPLAQRHPIGLVAGAALVGALFVRSHPWRWLLKPALFAGLIPQLAATVIAQVPNQSWMNLLISLLQQSSPHNPVQPADYPRQE